MPFFGQSTERTRPCCLRRPPPGEPFGDCRPDSDGRLPDLRHRSWKPGLPVARLRCLHGARSVARSRCRPDPVGRRTGLRCRRPPTRLPAEADPVAGVGASVCRLPGPVGPIDAVHADPVNRAIAVAPPEPAPHEQLGCPYDVGPELRPFLTTVARRSVGSKLVASRPVPDSLRLVGPARLRRFRPEDRTRTARFPGPGRRALSGTRRHFRGRETPGQAVFSNPQAYPLNFSQIPRISGFVHSTFTGAPGVFPTFFHCCGPDDRVNERCAADNGRDNVVDAGPSTRLNGPRCEATSPSSSSPRARGSSTCSFRRPPGGFFVARTTIPAKVTP